MKSGCIFPSYSPLSVFHTWLESGNIEDTNRCSEGKTPNPKLEQKRASLQVYRRSPVRTSHSLTAPLSDPVATRVQSWDIQIRLTESSQLSNACISLSRDRLQGHYMGDIPNLDRSITRARYKQILDWREFQRKGHTTMFREDMLKLSCICAP